MSRSAGRRILILTIAAFAAVSCNQPGWDMREWNWFGTNPPKQKEPAAGASAEGDLFDAPQKSSTQLASSNDSATASRSTNSVPPPGREDNTPPHRAMASEPSPGVGIRPVDRSLRSDSRDVVSSGSLLVNGETVTVQDVIDPIRPGLVDASKTLSYDEYRALVQQVVGARIWQLVNEILVYREASRILDDRVTEALDKEVDRIIQDRINKQFDGRTARFESHLQEIGLTEKRVRELTQRQVLVTEYLRRKFENAVPAFTRDELLAAYQTYREEFKQEASGELFLIEIPAAPADASASATEQIAARQQARSTAAQALRELKGGADFSAVARKYSKGVKASTGGSWGRLTEPLRGKLSLPSRQLFTMQSGEISEIIEGPDALFIIKAGEVTHEHTLTFEEAQPMIRRKLRADRMRELEEEYLGSLRQKANIQRWDEFKQDVIAQIPRPQNESKFGPNATAQSAARRNDAGRP